jgi:hypothetical protein
VEVPHWASVIYVGSSIPEEVERSAPLAVSLAAQDQFASRTTERGPRDRIDDLENQEKELGLRAPWMNAT